MDDFEYPEINKYTIYSKSGCKNCINVKKMLNDVNCEIKIINCDDFLIEDREVFLSTMKSIAQKDVKTFPMVFDKDKNFIGGYTETQNYISKNYINFENIFDNF
jgi:glutaredoxin